MNTKPKYNKDRLQLSLSEEFAAISFLILFIGMITVGWWLDKEIKKAVFEQTVQTTKIFVDSFYSNLVKELSTEDHLHKDSRTIIDSLTHNSPLGRQIALINIWSKKGILAYSSNPSINSGINPLSVQDLRKGNNQVNWELYDPQELKSHLGVSFKGELLEIILPIHQARSDQVIAVAELYFYTDQLQGLILKSQLHSLFLLFSVSLVTMILLYSVVRKGNKIIWMQQSSLEQQVKQLSDLLRKNEALHSKVLSATYKTSEVSEKLLRRISAELHDAPAQCLSFSLIKMDSIIDRIKNCSMSEDSKKALTVDLEIMQEATSDALIDIRNLSTQLSMPVLENLTPQAAIERVINIHQRRTNTKVSTDFCKQLEEPLPMAIMIGIYRFVQEALNNAYHHGQGINQHVMLKTLKNKVIVEVSDQGPGFDINKVDFTDDKLGLVGIRGRIKSLRGTFDLHSEINKGTTLSISLPYNLPK